MTQSLTTANPKALIGELMKPEMKIDTYGEKRWFLNGKLHREDGPAVEYPVGTKLWYLKGKEVSWRQVFKKAKTVEQELSIIIRALG